MAGETPSLGSGDQQLQGAEQGKTVQDTDGLAGSPTAVSQTELTVEPGAARGQSVGFPIVGLGASAGGLEALEAFFASMPEDTGMAFVVVQHLSPEFKSVMDELLARHTRIPIHRVSDSLCVEPNAIYLIPPKKEMIISSGKLLLSDKDPSSGFTLPIDIFFRSLAQDAGARAIGIVLSGTGSDGSRGICDIHEAGGLVIAQDQDSARFNGMPKSAAETGIVDFVIRPEQMPQALLSYIQHPSADGQGAYLPANLALLEGFEAIFQLLRKSYDIDFSYYKQTTVTRRVHRRLQMHQITDLEEYVHRLRHDPNELNLLYKDLLIGVTKFFRDTEAFQRVEQVVLPQIFAKLNDDQELRVWIAGCATGEEAYSLAILVHEQLERSRRKPGVKIFATDVHRASLEFASAGVYSESSVTEVSPERLARYFVRVKDGYRIDPALRQMIVFAPHNIIKDAPFTKIDLVTCRNLLIYLEPQAQKKALSLFHFALNTGSYIVMGPSESPGELSDEFESVDDRWKIYRKRRERRLPADMHMPLSSGYVNPRSGRGLNWGTPHATAAPDAPLIQAYDELLKQFAPPSLLINDRRELIQSFGGGAEFLKVRDGRPSSDVFDMLLPDLKTPLSTAVQQAIKRQTAVTFPAIRIEDGQGGSSIGLTVKPLIGLQSDTPYFLATFSRNTPQAKPTEIDNQTVGISLDEASKEQILTLEGELRYTKENLQATLEEMETSNEELQATNEELVASNEELQSTSEELHSVNEELYTVNAEYQKKISELTEMTADLDNLLQSTEVGVVFLDRDLCIRKFTPKIAEAFHLLPLDVGRRIESFAHNIDYPNLLEDLKRVVRAGSGVETEVSGSDGRTFLLRILPYRSKNAVEGVVLTLIDITRLKKAESKLSLMSKVFLDAADPIVIEDLSGSIQDCNDEAVNVFGYERMELVGQSIHLLIPREEQLRAQELRERCLENDGLRNIETFKCNKHGDKIPVLLTLSPLTDNAGKTVAIASSPKDITDQKRAEDTAREAVLKRDRFLAMLSHELRNPIGAALNATYLLNTSEQLPPDLADACHIIQRQALHVARLLDDLLDVSRVTQGKIEIRRQVVNLVDLVDDATQAVKPLMDSRRHELTVNVAPAPLYVEGDPARLLQIQENLLTNAARYTPHGGCVRWSVLNEDGEAVIRVCDNGSGIAPHMLESIFELFVQSDLTLDRTHGGMGIGLTLVKTLVELHGGTVSAHSLGQGTGSEFVVRLPLLIAPGRHDAELPSYPFQDKSKNRRIVLVEDNDDARHMLETLLKLDGHQVCGAGDGRQGMEMILRQRPEVAIVDIGLPQLNGYEVAKRVRQELSNEIYLIALTGYGRAEDREAVQHAGFDAHLVKPLKPVELARILNAIDGTPAEHSDSDSRRE